MKRNQLALFFTAILSFSAVAAKTDTIAVIATQQEIGSISTGAKQVFTKRFDVTLANLSDKAINLRNLCLIAVSPDGKSFKLDTVDDALLSGQLPAQGSHKGLAIFSADDASVYQAVIVKISDSCQ